MEKIPVFIGIVFGLTTLLSVFYFYKAEKRKFNALLVLLSWIVLQSIVALTGFYTNTEALPPRFVFLVLPPALCIAYLFLSSSGKAWLDKLDLKELTLLHTVRIPVELVLFGLFKYGAVPELMTFEGRNFDILSGISAPIIYYIAFSKTGLKKNLLLAWNIVCLALLLNIVINAALSVESPIQMQAFDQPNRAILYFPYNLLPSCIVPLVLLSHLASIRLILSKKNKPIHKSAPKHHK